MQFPPPHGTPLPKSRAVRPLAWMAVAALACLFVIRSARATRDPAGPYKKLDVFTHVLSLIENNYVEPVDEARLLYGAIEGMVRTLDPHSTFMDPRAYAALKQETDGEYGGIGLEVALKNGEIVVVAPLDDTPAARAGLKPGDKLLEIDGRSTRSMKDADANRALMGPPGTQVALKILREGWPAPRGFTLLRDVIRIVSVEERLFEKRFGYVKIKNFQDRTDSYLKKSLDTLRGQAGGQVGGLVLDLRHNPGGLLSSAVEVANFFVADGRIVSTKGRNQKERVFDAKAGDLVLPAADCPMVVLVNRYSASASEIVSAAIQDHQRAVIIGERSYGKGSVQNILKIEGDASALKLTTASYWRPSGENIHRFPDSKDTDKWGVRPSEGFEIKLSDEERLDYVVYRRDRDIIQGKPGAVPPPRPKTKDDKKDDKAEKDKKPFVDKMLEKALEHLREQVAKK